MDHHQIKIFASDLKQLQKTDPIQAERLFQNLPFEQQVLLIQNSPAIIARDIVFLAKDAKLILKELSQQKFAELSLQEYLEDSLTLLGNCTPEQFSFSMDIDIWKQGQVDNQRFLEWVEVIKEIPQRTLRSLLENFDINLLSTCLKKYVTVNLEESQLLLMEHLDNQYQYSMHDLTIENAEIEAFVQYLFFTEEAFFNRLIRNIALGDEEEIFNEAKGERDDRVQTEKLPSYEEALSVYIPLRELDLSFFNSLSTQSSYKREELHSPSSVHKIPFYEQVKKIPDFLDQLKPKTEQTLLKNLAILTNYVIIADGASPSEQTKYREAIYKATSLFNIGLEYLAESNVNKAISILKNYTSSELFQVAFTLLHCIRERASAILEDDNEILIRYSKHTTMLLQYMEQTPPVLYNEEQKKAYPIRNLQELTFLNQQLNLIEDQRKDFF